MNSHTTMRLLAAGRVALGITSLLAPTRFATAVGVTDTRPELAYMTQVYGARAIAMGTAYLTAHPDEKARWAKLALAVDISDTCAGAYRALCRDASGRAAALMITLTGTYAGIGAAHVLATRTR